MRPIKFRAWDGEKMWPLNPRAEDRLGMLSDLVSDDKWVVMQFTGLHDRNGVEVYEGDIVRAHRFYFNGGAEDVKEFTGKIVTDCIGNFIEDADQNQWQFHETSHFDEPCIEVIGNIHENSDLL